MASDTTNRKIYIWINGKQVENSYKGISNAIRKTRNELATMTMGTKEYYNKVRELKKLQGVMDQHNAAQGRIATGWRKIRQEIKQIAVGNLIANALTGVITKVGQTITFITNAVGEAEQGITNVLTLMSDADRMKYTDYLKAGQKEILEMGFAQADVNKALFDAVSAGVEAGQSIEFLKNAAVLAKGGVTQLGVAVDGMTSIQNAYNLSVSESGKIADAFFTAQKYGKTTVEELASSIGKVAPIASALGVSYQELLSASARLTLAGISTHESMTYLKAAMGNLMKPATESREAMEKWNIPMGLSEVRATGFTETLRRLNEVVKKSPDDLAKIIPSIEGQNAVLALTNKGFESYQKILNDVMKDVGANSSLQKAFAMQMETLPNLMAKAKGELTSMAISIGERLAPVIKAVIPMISGLGKGIMKLIDFITNNIKVIKLIVAATVSYVAALKLKSVWMKISTAGMNTYKTASLLLSLAQAKLTGNTTRAAAAQKMLNLSMKANPIGLIVSLVTTAVAAYKLYSSKIDETGRKQKMLNDLNVEARKQISEQKIELEMLLRIAQDDNRSKSEKAKAIQRLNEISPEMLGNITEETIKTGEATAAVDEYIKALENETRMKIGREKMAEIDANIFALEIEQLEKINEIKKRFNVGGNIFRWTVTLGGSEDMNVNQINILERNINNLKTYYGEKINTEKKYRDEYQKILDDLGVSIVDSGNTFRWTATLGGSGGGGFTPPNTPDVKSSQDLWDKYMEMYKKYMEEMERIRKAMYQEGKSEWQRELDEIEGNYFNAMQVTGSAISELEAKGKKINEREADLLGKLYQQQIDLTGVYEEQILNLLKKYGKSKEELLKDEQQKEIDGVTAKYADLILLAKKFGEDYTALEKAMNAEIQAIREKYNNTEEAEVAGVENINDKTLSSLQERVNMAKTYADELGKIWSAYNQARTNEEDAYLERVEANNEKQKRILQQRLDFGLISETEYTNRIKKNEQRLELEKKRIARDQAVREKRMRIFETTINGISAAVEALPNYILAALIGVTTAASVAAIASEDIPQFGSGARVNKPTIAMVGEKGKEIVLSNSVVDDPTYGPIADDLARLQEGKQPRFLGQPQIPNYSGMNRAIASTNITNNTVVNQVDSEGMDKLAKKVEEMTKAVLAMKYIQAVISDKELTERDKDKELLLRYSRF